MQTEEWALVASVVFTGLWSGLLAMLTLVMHPMLAKMEFREFVQFLRAFLPVARRSPFNYAAIAGMIVAPVIALIAVGVPGDGVFVLTALGLVLTIADRYLYPIVWPSPTMRSCWAGTRMVRRRMAGKESAGVTSS